MKVAAIASALSVSAGSLALSAAVHLLPSGTAGSSVTNQLAAYTTALTSTTRGNGGVAVSGRFGHAPHVRFPASNPPGALVADTVIRGTGPVLHKTDAFAMNLVAYKWHGHSTKLLQNTFRTGGPELATEPLLRGLVIALTGKKIGSRMLAILPPGYAFGSTGNPQAGVGPDDTLVFVIDLIEKFPARASAHGVPASSGGGSLPTVTVGAGRAGPAVRIPRTPPPAGLIVKTLIQGAGSRVARHQLVVVQYVGVNWRTGKVFDATWSRSTPFGFRIAVKPAQVIAGFDTGLLGVRTGSRVLMVIPPSEGYGTAGNQQAGIRGTDTIVFVVDVLGTVNSS